MYVRHLMEILCLHLLSLHEKIQLQSIRLLMLINCCFQYKSARYQKKNVITKSCVERKVLKRIKKRSDKKIFKKKKKMALQNFCKFALASIFAINLIVSGIPVDKVETTTLPEEETNSTSPNGTHKEL
jgi:hypothetical protein